MSSTGQVFDPVTARVLLSFLRSESADEDTVMNVASHGLTVTIMVSVPGLPALSVAVTFIVVSPIGRFIPEADQFTIPLATPLSPFELFQVMALTPLVSSRSEERR